MIGKCGSDVSQLNGDHHVPGEVALIVPGHEIVGRIHALAPDELDHAMALFERKARGEGVLRAVLAQD